MTGQPTDSESRNQWAIWGIRIVLLAALIAIIRPVPAMIGYENRAEGQVFGRYTIKYFGLMTAYLLGVCGWLLATIGALVGLNRQRLETIRTWIAKHIAAATAATTAAVGGLIGLRILLLRKTISFPGAYADQMPGVVMMIWLALAAAASLITDSRIVKTIDERFGKCFEKLWGVAANKPGLLTTAGLVLVAGLLTIAAMWGDFAHLPLYHRDAAAHIYLGQLVMRGGRPYVDLIYFHPPLRFGVSWLINVIADAFHLPVVPTFHVSSYLLALGVLASVYLIGKELTGSQIGGVFSAVVLLGIDHLQLLLLEYGPNFVRLSTLLLMLLGVRLAQRKRWFWSAALVTSAALIWAPAAAAIGGVITAAVVSKEKKKWRALLSIGGGTALILAVTAAVLAGAGILEAAFVQTVKSVWRYFTITASPSPRSSSALHEIGKTGRIITRYIFRDNQELLIFIVLGPALMAIKKGWGVFRQPKFSVLLAGGLAMLGVFAFDNEGSISDGIMFCAILVPFGAATISAMIPGKPAETYPRTYGLFASLALAFLLALGLADNRFPIDETQPSLAERQRAAAEIDALLGPDDRVQFFFNTEFLIYSGRINALPVFSWGGKTDVYKLAGWSDERIGEQLEALAPVIVEAPKESLIETDWFRSRYTKVIDGEGESTGIYVWSERADLIEALSEQAETFK